LKLEKQDALDGLVVANATHQRAALDRTRTMYYQVLIEWNGNHTMSKDNTQARIRIQELETLHGTQVLAAAYQPMTS
jgi:hypothetical protein